MKDKFGNQLFVYPIHCQKDTLMACFSMSLIGKTFKKDRMNIRKKLLHRFNECLNEEDCYKYPAIHSFVHRLHLIYPDDIPRSAETFFFSSKSRFYHEGIAFIQKHQKEGFISDKYIFAYLLSDLYQVAIHFFTDDDEEEEVIITCQTFDSSYFSIYIKCEKGGGFSLLSPSMKGLAKPYHPPLGIVSKSVDKTIKNPVYDLRMCADETHCPVVGKFAPPSILGARVHKCVIHSTQNNVEYVVFPIKNIWSEILKPDETLHVFDGNATLLSCVSHHGKTNPYFYLPEMKESILYIIVDKTEENAEKLLKLEINGGMLLYFNRSTSIWVDSNGSLYHISFFDTHYHDYK